MVVPLTVTIASEFRVYSRWRAWCFTPRMRRRSTLARSLRIRFATVVRDGRAAVGWTQAELGVRAHVSRGMIARVETGDVNLTFEAGGTILEALGIQADLYVRMPFVAGPRRQRDAAHARCSAYVQRRLERAGWLVAREVEVVHGRSHGWIDLLAFNPLTRVLIVIEIKTQLDDVGEVERTLGWYQREAWGAAKARGWRPARVAGWLLVLATEASDDRIRVNREALAVAFPGRVPGLLDSLPARALAMIDPSSRRRDWLIRSRVDGRRSVAPYRDYADFMRSIRGS